MKNIYFTVAWIISLILGIIFTITIAGAILGIPLIIASTKFNSARKMNDEELVKNRGNLFGWGIFLAIVLAPSIIGLIVILIFVFMVNNYIKNLENGDMEKANKGFGETVKEGASKTLSGVKEGASKTWSGFKETFGIKSKLEKQKDQLAELQKMKEDGIINEEEYEAKRKQILGL